MLIVEVKDNESIEKALKKFKKKFERTGVMRELRSRSQFIKPSIVKRKEKLRAIYRTQMQAAEENQ